MQIDAIVKREDKIIGESMLTRFVFDQELNPALFDTTPPEGWFVSEGGFMSLEPGDPVE